MESKHYMVLKLISIRFNKFLLLVLKITHLSGIHVFIAISKYSRIYICIYIYERLKIKPSIVFSKKKLLQERKLNPHMPLSTMPISRNLDKEEVIE